MISNTLSKFEMHFVPACFILGLIGNLLGTITILSSNKLRKRTVFFILAIIGITDSILLASQLQRWLAVTLDEQLYLLNNSLCKFYLMLVRSSVLSTSSLLLAVSFSSVIRLYFGHIHLSTHSKLGQVMSKLCVLIAIALSMSVSWHELWTSGLRNSTHSIHLIEVEDEDGFEISSHLPDVADSDVLICSKNIDSILIIEIINYVYFTICILINLFLVFNSLLICIKLKRVNFCSKLCNDTIIITSSSLRKKTSINKHESFCIVSHSNDQASLAIRSSFNRTYGTDVNLNKSYSVDFHEVHPTTSKNSTDNIVRPQASSVSKQFKPSPRKFTHYIVVVTLVSSLFCLPFVVFDLIFYRDVLMQRIQMNNSTAQMEISNSDFRVRLPLILINIPHMIKFYLLFAFNSKFRAQLSRFVRVRFYLNAKMLRSMSVFQRATANRRETKKRANSAYIEEEEEEEDNENYSNIASTDTQTPSGKRNNSQNSSSNNAKKSSFKRERSKIEFKFSFYPNCLPFFSSSLNNTISK